MPRGKPGAVFTKDGYQYNGKKAVAGGSRLLHCLSRKKEGCKVTAYLRPSKNVSVHGDHIHPPDEEKAEAVVARRKLTELAESSALRPREAITAAKKGLSPGALQFVGSDSALRKAYNRAKPNDPDTSLADLPPHLFAGALSRTLGGDSFLLHDSGELDPRRFVIFSSQEQLRVLAGSKSISYDGTFDIAPAPFNQVFTICCEYNGRFVPSIFALMMNRSASDYDRMVHILRQSAALSSWCPDECLADFELAAANSMAVHFPAMKLSFCLFHKSQAVTHKVATLGHRKQLVGAYRTAYDRILSLPFLPSYQISAAHAEIEAAAPLIAKPLLQYHRHSYVGTGTTAARYAPSLWSTFDRASTGRPRTNNSQEAFHKQMNAFAKLDMAGQRIVTPSSTIAALQHEEERARQFTVLPFPRMIPTGARKPIEEKKDEDIKKVLAGPIAPPFLQILDKISFIMRG